MRTESGDWSAPQLPAKRLNEFLQPLAAQGLTQVEVAARAGLPPQYISDIKRGRRPMTELVARRLGEKFGVNFQWLLGTSDLMDWSGAPVTFVSTTTLLWLPVLPHPIDGDPRQHVDWKGGGVHISGIAAAKAELKSHPYVLEFGHGDVAARLRQGDLLLIVQAANTDAEIHVVRYRRKSFLARKGERGDWIRVANGQALPSDSPATGHCVGIVWSSLV